SRRRHTRFSRDWSSDVCSSDLKLSHNHFEFPKVEIIKNCCPSCNHNMKFVPIHHRLTFYYHYHNTYSKIMTIDFCSKTCANDFRSEERRVGKECRNICATKCA